MDSSATLSLERDNNETISRKKSKRDSEYDEGDVKSSKKKSKKSSKEHKTHKEKRQKKAHTEDIIFELNKPLQEVSSVIENTVSSKNINAVMVDAVQLSKVDFFANLASSESKKPAVGTIHAGGKKVDQVKKDSNWTCPKCSTSNQNNSHQCHKCKAIKRMTEYR